ncbi:MAG: type III pantothenate kinase [Flavobacteriaceae bacterium]|nr:type III pantothenate kinase [Flavobacteriaceae bacterium]
MNLSIDIGNSNVKIAVFRTNKVEKVFFSEKENLLIKLRDIKVKYTIKAAILSTVSVINPDIFDEIYKLFPTKILDINLKFPFQIKYKTKETLGVDRLALVAAAVSNYPKKNVLIIDAGTCITYDFKTKGEIYLGGAIAPGILMRYKALHNQTANLPLLIPKHPKNNIGNSTQQSIHNGVCKGVIYEIEGVISQYMTVYPNLTVVLTGGDTNFLSEMLKSSIFANPNFLFEGLNHILNHNLQE